jgi:hypothetical protein
VKGPPQPRRTTGVIGPVRLGAARVMQIRFGVLRRGTVGSLSRPWFEVCFDDGVMQHMCGRELSRSLIALRLLRPTPVLLRPRRPQPDPPPRLGRGRGRLPLNLRRHCHQIGSIPCATTPKRKRRARKRPTCPSTPSGRGCTANCSSTSSTSRGKLEPSPRSTATSTPR